MREASLAAVVAAQGGCRVDLDLELLDERLVGMTPERMQRGAFWCAASSGIVTTGWWIARFSVTPSADNVITMGWPGPETQVSPTT